MARQEKKIFATVDAPEIDLLPADLAGDVLINFYRALGWNGIDALDPRLVRTTKEIYDRLYDAMLAKCPDSVTVGMALVNKGPGVDEDVLPGKVYLLEGWVIPAQARKGGAEA